MVSFRLTGRLIAIVVVGTLLAGAGGCGYQLRGSANGAASGRDLRVDGPSWLVDELDLLLEAAGGEVFTDARKGVAQVRYRDDDFDRRTISVDSDTGKAREVELAYSLYFDLRDAAGAKVLDNVRVSLLRDLTIDPDAILGTVSEAGVLQDEMRREAVSQLLRRVESALPQ